MTILKVDPSKIKQPLKTAVIYALANLTIEEGEITDITPSMRITGAFAVEEGEFWVFFEEPQEDLNYIPLCYNHGHTVFVSERSLDYFVVSSRLNGVPANPQNISIEIKRVN